MQRLAAWRDRQAAPQLLVLLPQQEQRARALVDVHARARAHTATRARLRTRPRVSLIRYSLLMQRQYNGARSLLALPIVGRGDVHPPVRKQTHNATGPPAGKTVRQQNSKPTKQRTNKTGETDRPHPTRESRE